MDSDYFRQLCYLVVIGIVSVSLLVGVLISRWLLH